MYGAESNDTCEGIYCSDWILLPKGNLNSKMPYQCNNRKINNILKVFHFTQQNYKQGLN